MNSTSWAWSTMWSLLPCTSQARLMFARMLYPASCGQCGRQRRMNCGICPQRSTDRCSFGRRLRRRRGWPAGVSKESTDNLNCICSSQSMMNEEHSSYILSGCDSCPARYALMESTYEQRARQGSSWSHHSPANKRKLVIAGS